MDWQTAFAQGLRQPEAPLPEGLRSWNQSDPAPRYAVHRNNVVASLIDALQTSFPVTLQLVGVDFFRGMARSFVLSQPLHSRILVWVGRDFPAFIEGFAPARGLAFLPDLARLEWLRICAYHAADQSSLSPQALAQPLSHPDSLAQLRLSLHPSVQLLNSPFAVYSIWIAHHGLLDLAAVDVGQRESVLIYRSGLDVRLALLEAAQAHCIHCLQQKAPLAQAASEACALAPDFDLSATLGLLIRQQLIVEIQD